MEEVRKFENVQTRLLGMYNEQKKWLEDFLGYIEKQGKLDRSLKIQKEIAVKQLENVKVHILEYSSQ